MPIDREGPEYMWRQLAAFYREKIVSGEIPVGRRLPAKKAMEQEHGVSQKTVERALRQLREEGLVQSVIGRGMYVRHPEHWQLEP